MLFENTEVFNFKNAIRGMRNPKESWKLSDSKYRDTGQDVEKILKGDYYNIGSKDLQLMQMLIKAGSEHRKFMRQIFVSVDIIAPFYWWKEFDTYKVGTVANSTSTMHKLASTPITMNCFEMDDYAELDNDFCADMWISLVVWLECLRQKYNETKDKRYWKELVRLLPESWLQKRTVTMNYENILNMYQHRKNHKLNEWSGKDDPTKPNFCSWILELPYAKQFFIEPFEVEGEKIINERCV